MLSKVLIFHYGFKPSITLSKVKVQLSKFSIGSTVDVLLTHAQEAMMEVSMEALEALETKAVGLGAKGLVGWEEVEAEEDMGPTLETWVAGAPEDLVAVSFFSFPTSLRSSPM